MVTETNIYHMDFTNLEYHSAEDDGTILVYFISHLETDIPDVLAELTVWASNLVERVPPEFPACTGQARAAPRSGAGGARSQPAHSPRAARAARLEPMGRRKSRMGRPQ